MAPLLTAALIARDEADFLPDCLSSLQGIVDEIVVVDTGSTDATPEIARAFGAKVAHQAWTDDFSAARNTSLDMASGEWILYIDADETLVGTTRPEVEALLSQTDCIALRLLLQPYSWATPYREYRLWRNDRRIRFDGVIHEKVVPAIHAVSSAEGRPIGTADFLLVHRGYEGDQTRKHLRNLPLLRRQLEIEPWHLFAHHHLARVLAGLGDEAGSEEALRTGVEVARSLANPPGPAVLLYADLINLCQQRGEDVGPLLAEARQAFPDNCVLVWLEVRQLMASGKHGEAIGLLDELLAVELSELPERGPAYETRLFGELPLDAKGACLMRLGSFAEAAEAYAAAALCAPQDSSYRVKEALARARAGRRLAERSGADSRKVSAVA